MLKDGEMEILTPDGGRIAVRPGDGSRVREALMQPAWVELQFARTAHVEVPVGSWVEVEGRRFTLLAPCGVTRAGAGLFEYRARFESEAGGLDALVVVNPADGRVAFTLTATPREHARLVVDNMNARGGGGWTLGACVEGAAKEVAYDGTRCLEALGRIAEAFGTEWRCEGREVSLGPVGHGADSPVRLAYGRGLRPGVQREVHGEDGNPIGRLFVQGGERNVDYASYGARRLHLPRGASVRFDGARFEGEAGFAEARAVRYVTDAEGRSVARADAPAGAPYREASLALPEVYPRREGTVTAVGNEGVHFRDSGIPEDLNYRDARIPGERATVVFQSGMLAGREFALEQREDDLTGYNHPRRAFTLVAQEEDGVPMPGGAFVPRVGDRYAVFHVRLPGRYVADAEGEMLRAAVRHLHPRAWHRFSVRAEVDGASVRGAWDNLGGRLGLGGHVEIEDAELFGAGGCGGRAVLRIVGVSRPLEDPYSPTLELSNEPVGGGLAARVEAARGEARLAQARAEEGARYARRSYREAREGMRALETAAREMGERFEASVRPATVRTMGLLAGSEATNFEFLDAVEFVWHAAGRYLTAGRPGGAEGPVRLRHASLGLPEGAGGVMRPGVDATRAWRVPAFRSGSLGAARDGTPYFLYADCAEGGDEGAFRLYESPRPLREGDKVHLLVALLSSAGAAGARSVQPVHGVTEVLPGALRTERIVSRDGRTYFDLSRGEIGGRIAFTEPEAGRAAPGPPPAPNLFVNGGPAIPDTAGWRVNPGHEAGWKVELEQVQGSAHGGWGRMRYTARREGGAGSPGYAIMGQIVIELPAGFAGRRACAAVGVARCSHPRGVDLSAYSGGRNYTRFVDELRGSADPIARGEGEPAEAVVFGDIPREGDNRDFVLSWSANGRRDEGVMGGEEVVLEIVWAKVEEGPAFTGLPGLGRAGEAAGLTVVQGGLLRTGGLELTQGRGAAARATAGLWGGGEAGAYAGDEPAFWAGGTLAAARVGQASTVLRHDGSAKIGPMLLGREGDMRWVDNGGEFSIRPRESLPPLEAYHARAGMDALESRTLYSMGAPGLRAIARENENEDRFDVTERREAFQARDGAYTGVEATLTVRLAASMELRWERSKNRRGSMYVAMKYTARAAGSEYSDIIELKPENYTKGFKEMFKGEKKHTFTCRPKGTVEIVADFYGGISIDVGGERGNVLPSRAELLGVEASVQVKFSYSSARGVQLFDICRNGMCLYMGENRYLYSNSDTGDFIMKGVRILP